MRCLSLCALILLASSCASITLPDVRVCAVAGKLTHGMDCAYTISNKTESLTFEQSVELLEPSDLHGGALVMSPGDWNRLKTEIDKACKIMGDRCQKEKVPDALKKIDSVVGPPKK